MDFNLTSLLLLLVSVIGAQCNQPPIFTEDMNNYVLAESTPVGTVVYTLHGEDPEGSPVRYSLSGTDKLQVDAVSGKVTLVKQLDREVNDTLRLYVILEDNVGLHENEEIGTFNIPNQNNNIVQVPITVIITDENDNSPVFEDTPYEVTIAEDTPPGLTIYWSIHVTDADLVGDVLNVSCATHAQFPDACHKFSISAINASEHEYYGVISLADSLDYSKRQFYQLILAVTDGKFTTTSVVEIKVADVQNTPPIFVSSLVGVVQEDAPIGMLVMTVQAKDGDTGHPRNIIYELVTNPQDYFLLDSKTGELRTAKPLDKESLEDSTGVLSLKIRAYEMVNGTTSEDPSTVTTAVARVTIKDVNDEPPRFNQREYFIEIPENIPVDTPLPRLDMSVTDPDVGSNSVFQLGLIDVSGVFDVEPKEAVGSTSVSIRVAEGSLDYENPNQRKFIILVVAEEVHTSPKLSSTATITVTITDVNDNAPYFENIDPRTESYTATVSETAEPGEVVTSIVAKDKDSHKFGVNGIVYQLEGNGADRFSVSSRTGVIAVAKCDGILGRPPCLDYETNTEYHLTYKATDNDGTGQTSQVSLRILLTDSNDNPPKFIQPVHRVSVDEGAKKLEPTLNVNARDQDKTSLLEYSIIAGNVNDLFHIDPNTAELSIADPVTGLDVTHVQASVFNLTVQVSDGKYTDTCVVIITVADVNNNAPVFTQDYYEVTVPEEAEPDRVVEQVAASDADTGQNSELTYRIQSGAFDKFTVDEHDGTVVLSKKLDYDTRQNYTIEIVAVDSGVPSQTGTTTLLVHVTNSNDKHPYLQPVSQRTEVSESASVGHVFYTVVAEDPDVSSADGLMFEIAEPIFAIDQHGKRVNHTNVFKDFFKIDQTTGEVSVAMNLDRNVAAVITLTIVVTDTTAEVLQQGKGMLIITIIDVNDHAPTFAKPWTKENPSYKLELFEAQPVDTTISTFTAMDLDSNIAYYTIEPDSEYFRIDNSTGVVRLRKELDYEKDTRLNFTVWAYDSGQPQFSSSAFVQVEVQNVNDNEPMFSQSSIEASVSENSPPGTSITVVSATDADVGVFGQITYSLVGVHSNDFSLGHETGVLRVANAAILDREEITMITVQVMASDGAPADSRKATSIPINIRILDINDNAPKFTRPSYSVEIFENISLDPPAKIVQVQADDPDEAENGTVRYYITSGNSEELFKIDEETGILYPSKSLEGFERTVHMTVEGKDGGGLTGHTTVEVVILDVNHDKPKFILPSLPNATVEVPENAGFPDYLVMTVKAKDSDPGENGRITYHLKVNNTNVQETHEFTIHPETGELRTKIIFDREEKAKYEIMLVARDHGTPTSYETLRFLTILLVDTNDNEPQFETELYEFHVLENSPVKTEIGRVVANDKDEGKHARIYYYIVSGNEEGSFVIDRMAGLIRANVSFDRETQDQYNLMIKASNEPDYYPQSTKDLHERDTSITRVKVVILDENDNVPVFDRQDYYAGIKSLASINEFVAKMTAEDLDLGENGTVEYYIAASNLYKSGSLRSSGSIVPSPFNISNDGKIVSATFMAEYNQDRFVLEIVAKEKAQPERESRVKVHVWVFEPNQLIRVILSRPPEEVHRERDEIVAELSNATQSLVVIDDIRYHVDMTKHVHRDWSDMYIHVVENQTQLIYNTQHVLKVIDAKYDFLKDYYSGFAIENVIPAVEEVKEESFDSALAALVALLIVLFVGSITFVVVCCCLRNWVISLPASDDLKKKDALIKKAILEELNTTENPLWMEQKLKLYEEQELTMQVFTDPDNTCDTMRRDSAGEISQGDNMYATIQHPNRRGSSHDMDDYETLTNPHRNIHSSSNQSSLRSTAHRNQPHHLYEAALGFQGSTFQVPLPVTPTTEHRQQSHPRQHHRMEDTPEYVAELL